MKTKKHIPALIIALVAFVVINYQAGIFHQRFDLTQDKRYTLSEPAKQILDQIKSPLIIDVFLEGEFPAEFNKLQNETRYLLEEFQAYNPNISFIFSDPVEEGSDATTVAGQFADFGMKPTELTVKKNGKESQQLIFPWATANHNGKATPIPLLKNITGASRERLVSASTQNLEYAFVDAFNKLVNAKSKKIAVLKGIGELPDAKMADMLKTLGDTYFIAPFPMGAVDQDPEKALLALQNTFDLVLVAKPTKTISDTQKFVLDQYTMNGGKSLWLIDAVAMETDSLYSNQGTTLAFSRNLNLNDFFFKYGLRINPVLTKDLYSAPLALASGDGTETQYVQRPWFYQPVVTTQNNHPITTNVERPVRFEYVNQIDTLSNTEGIKKTVLLQSSILSRKEGIPKQINLSDVSIEPNEEDYTAGPQNLAVLAEGQFTSAFKNRVLPVQLEKVRFRESAQLPSKIVLIADGDLIANSLDPRGNPMELGFDFFTRTSYGNKEFLLNTINYLMDDTGLINIRSKTIALPFLDAEKTETEISKWQVLSIGLPLVFLLIFGLIFYTLRKRKYAR